jgi:hypothetical protein
MYRDEALERALALVTKERETQHGPADRNAEVVAALWSAYTGKKISEHDVPVMLALMKIGRLAVGDPKVEDHWVDAIGYLSIGVEICTVNSSDPK